MSPLKSVEFVPPRVKTPPGATDAGSVSRASQNDISGALSCLSSIRACQKGVALIAARGLKAKPIRPDAGAGGKEPVISSTDTRWC